MPNEKEYLAKKSLLDTKQDTLTAGANININNNNVISVQGLPKDVKVDGSSVVDINGNANINLTGKQDALAAGNNITIQNNVISANIEANPQDTPTDDLDSIEIDGTVYNIAGSGGSSVTPNPIGTPTDTLNTVEIDGTIFDIEGSGSGSGLIDDTIYSSSVDNSVIPLSNSIANYDYIWIMAGYSQDGQDIKIASIFNTSDLKDAIGTTERFGISNDAYYTYFSVDSLTQFSKYTWQDKVFIQEVHGLKFSGGSGGGGGSAYTETLLYDSGSPITGAPFNQDVALLDNLSKYDTILIEWNTSQDRTNVSPNEETDTVFCTVEELLRNNFILHFTGYGTRWGDIKFTDTSFRFINRGGDKNPEIYKIKGLKFEGGSGGGGSGEISDEVIFTDTAGTIGSRNITLTKSLNNFDAVYFEWFGTTEEQYTASHVTPVYPIEANDNGNVSVVCYPTYGNRYIVLTGDPTSTSVSLESGTWETVPLSVYKIHGVKFSGGGGGSSSHKDFKNLITSPITKKGTVTLNDSIENYGFIEVELTYLNGEGNPICGSTMASVEYLKNNYNSTTSIWVDGGNNDRSVKVAFTDGTTMIVNKASVSDAITGVYGINIQSGGGGGSESKYEQVDLYVNQGITQPNTITLSQNISDFDAIVIENVSTLDVNAYRTTDYFLADEMSVGKYYTCLRWATNNEFINFQITALNTLTMVEYRNMYTTRVVGVKYGAGGGGGTSVEANPQEEPTDTLTKIKIEDTVYEIQGGGSSEGSGLQQTVLWDYVQDNSGTIPYDIYSVTLRDNINNYDAITLELVSWSGDLDGSWRGTNISNTFFVDMLNNQLEPGNIVVCTFDQRSVKFYIHDNIVSTTVRNERSTNGLVRVYGLTFGGGKAASEIIPISAGDGTTSRTFTFDKTPKKVTLQGYTSGDGGWYESGYFIWGENFMALMGAQGTIATGGYAGQAAISYGADGKSFTITAANAFGAFNRADSFSGMMLVDYGGGSEGPSEPGISDMTWTAITSTSYGQSTAVAIPQGTKRLVLTAEYDGIVTKVAEEKIKNIQKLLDTSLQNTWNMGAEYADTSGNHTFVAMSVNNNLATAYSGYSGVVVKIYALS